jgi:replicative DNA helicase
MAQEWGEVQGKRTTSRNQETKSISGDRAMSNLRNKAVESEQALLGCAILNSEWIAQSDITVDDFLRDDHRAIWRAIAGLLENREPVDMVTVYQQLTEAGKDGKRWIDYLTELARNTPSTSNWQGYLSALRRHGQRVKVQEILSSAQENLARGEDVADDTISRLMAINHKSANHDCAIQDAITGAVEHLEAARAGKIHAITTGVPDLDQAVGGWHDSDLIVVAGRPAMGKTAVLMNLLLAGKVPAGVISGEQPRDQVGMRALAIDGSISVQAMRTAQMQEDDWKKLMSSVSKLHKSRIWINDMPSPTLTEIQRQARAWVHRYGVKIIFVDYIQKIEVSGDAKRHEQVGIVVRGLKSLARELNVPIVALAQVKREVENRNDKRPNMGDISDSSEVEKEADQVITLYRDEVYDEDSEHKGIIEFYICKNRHGPTGVVRAVWRGEYMQVKGIAKGYGNG